MCPHLARSFSSVSRLNLNTLSYESIQSIWTHWSKMAHMSGIFLLWMTSLFLSCDCHNRTWTVIDRIGGNTEWVHSRVWENGRKAFAKLFTCLFWDLGIWQGHCLTYISLIIILSKPNSHNLKTTNRMLIRR